MAGTGRRVVFVGKEHEPCLVQEEHVIPEIEQGEILVKVLLATICGSDLHTLNGTRKEPTPSVLGHEAVGEVVLHKRSPSDHLAPGDRITFTVANSCNECDRCLSKLPQKCEKLMKYGHCLLSDGTGFNGCYASHIVLRPGTSVFKIPDNVSNRMAAPINCALATVINAVSGIADGGKRSVALVQGAGMLGLYGCAVLNEMGYEKVYCMDVNQERLQLSMLFGAIPCNTIIGGSQPAPDTVDIVLEACGAPSVVTDGMRLLRPGGIYILVGMVHPNSKLEITGEQIIRKCLTIKGIHNYAAWHLEEAVRFVASTANKYPYERMVEGQYELQNVEQAIALAQTQKYLRIALKP